MNELLECKVKYASLVVKDGVTIIHIKPQETHEVNVENIKLTVNANTLSVECDKLGFLPLYMQDSYYGDISRSRINGKRYLRFNLDDKKDEDLVQGIRDNYETEEDDFISEACYINDYKKWGKYKIFFYRLWNGYSKNTVHVRHRHYVKKQRLKQFLLTNNYRIYINETSLNG